MGDMSRAKLVTVKVSRSNWLGGSLDFRPFIPPSSTIPFPGGPLADETTQETETPILDGGTAVVTGSSSMGYSISIQSW